MITISKMLKYFSLIVFLSVSVVEAAPTMVTVEQAYVDVHTGPGIGFPVFTVIERGHRFNVLAEQGPWFKVQSDRQEVGWVAGEAIAVDAVNHSPRVSFAAAEHAYNSARNYMVGVDGGMLWRDYVYRLSGSYHMLKGLHMDMMYAQSAGLYMMSNYYSVGLQWYLWSEQRFSPSLFVAGGELQGNPRATLYPALKTQAGFVSGGLSVRMRMTDRFFIRTGVGIVSIQQSKVSQPNFWEWQIGVQTYL